MQSYLVIPAKAGIQLLKFDIGSWTPAFAGVTGEGGGENV
jgi:hypothetical protein